jgi:hypothetical protein
VKCTTCTCARMLAKSTHSHSPLDHRKSPCSFGHLFSFPVPHQSAVQCINLLFIMMRFKKKKKKPRRRHDPILLLRHLSQPPNHWPVKGRPTFAIASRFLDVLPQESPGSQAGRHVSQPESYLRSSLIHRNCPRVRSSTIPSRRRFSHRNCPVLLQTSSGLFCHSLRRQRMFG